MNKLIKNKIYIIILSLGLFLTGCDDIENNPSNTYEKAKVVQVIDGDTLRVEIDGKKHKLRLVGIDTPEIDKEDGSDDYYGRDAYLYTKDILDGQYVFLEKDVSDTDHYDRILRYVWIELPDNPAGPSKNDLGEKSINGILVANGYAYANHYPPDDKYYELLKELEDDAKANNLGIWDYEAASNFGNDIKEEDLGGPIRGNKNSMIYHLPNGEGYDKISPRNIIEFETEDQARRAGFRKSRK